MSRIGKSPISIPEKVTVTVSTDNVVTVKGPKGELNEPVNRDLSVEIDEENNEILVKRPTDQIRHRALHGLNRALLANMIEGVTNGFKKELELHGVGFRATVQGQTLDMSLGYSHNIIFELPKEVSASAEMQKGQPPRITLESIDKQLVGQVAAKIRSMRKPEPYKGKGVRYKGEYIRRKAGKAAGK